MKRLNQQTNPFTGGKETEIYVPSDFRRYVYDPTISFEQFTKEHHYTPFEIENKAHLSTWNVVNKWRRQLMKEKLKQDTLARMRKRA